jgi:RNA polymerase primary sigma factor
MPLTTPTETKSRALRLSELGAAPSISPTETFPDKIMDIDELASFFQVSSGQIAGWHAGGLLVSSSMAAADSSAPLFDQTGVEGFIDTHLLSLVEAHGTGKRRVIQGERSRSMYGLRAGEGFDEPRMLLRSLKSLSAEWVHHPLYEIPAARQIIMRPVELPSGTSEENASTAEVKRELYDTCLLQMAPTLSCEQEQRLFHQLNFLKHSVYEQVRKLHPETASSRDAELIDQDLTAIAALQSLLVRSNMALVLAMYKRSKIPIEIGDAISDGGLAILRSVNKFDASRGFKFSTYTCHSIIRAFLSRARTNARQRGHESPAFPQGLSNIPQRIEPAPRDSDARAKLRRDLAQAMRRALSPVEQQILKARFGLGGKDGRLTLEKTGQLMGLTKERVRQLQNRALKKLRERCGRDLDELF